jgi:ABC-type multidrug transport system permease subunit
MSYPAPPPASQPPSEQPSSGGSGASRASGLSRAQAGGFFNDLLDVRFTRFVSLRLISVVYVVILVAVSLVALGVVFAGFANGAAAGLFTLVLAVLGWVIYVVLARVALEAFAVLFRIHDDTSRMAEALGGVPPTGGAPQAYDQPPPGGYGTGGGYGSGGYGAGGGFGGQAQPGQDPSGPPWV